MRIFIDVNSSIHGETKEDSTKYFYELVDKLEHLGYDSLWSRDEFAKGTAITAIIGTDFLKGNGYPPSGTYKCNKNFTTQDMGFVGAMFCSHSPDKYPLSLKTVLDNFEEIVIKENETLLKILYIKEKKEYEEKRRK